VTYSTEQVILEELREFRAQVQPWMQEQGERMATVETKLDAVYGSDKPGTIEDLQSRVESLEKWRNTLGGGFAGLAFALGWVLKLYYGK
jgi:hypothetical protein